MVSVPCAGLRGLLGLFTICSFAAYIAAWQRLVGGACAPTPLIMPPVALPVSHLTKTAVRTLRSLSCKFQEH